MCHTVSINIYPLNSTTKTIPEERFPRYPYQGGGRTQLMKTTCEVGNTSLNG